MSHELNVEIKPVGSRENPCMCDGDFDGRYRVYEIKIFLSGSDNQSQTIRLCKNCIQKMHIKCESAFTMDELFRRRFLGIWEVRNEKNNRKL